MRQAAWEERDNMRNRIPGEREKEKQKKCLYKRSVSEDEIQDAEAKRHSNKNDALNIYNEK